MGRTLSRCLGTVSVIALLAPLPAAAQTGQTAQGASGIEEIVVTAQRRAENLQSVPIAITAFSSETIERQGLTDISRLENLAPGFTFGKSGVDARPALRGVRTENVGVNGDTTIGFFIDGIYQSRAAQASASFVDIERIELQRGPQGTLYGRNTFGGNISIQTKDPTDELEGGISLLGGSYGRFRGEAYVNAPINQAVSVRLAGAYETSNGWVKNDNPLGNNLFDDDLKYVRGSVRIEPNDRFKAVLKVDYTDQGGAGGSAFGYKQVGSYFYLPTNAQLFNATPVFLNVRPGLRDGIIDPPLGIDGGAPLYRADTPYRIDTDQPTFLDLENTSVSATLSYDFDAVTVRSITGYTDFDTSRTSDSDFSSSQIAIDFQRTAAETFSQELQALSNTDGPFSYVAGAYYFSDKLNGTFINQQLPRIIRSVTPKLSLAQNGAGFYDEQRAETESLAGYLQGSYEITDQLKVTLGGRYTRDKKDFKFANANAILPRITNAAGLLVPDGTQITLRTGGVPESAFGSEGAATNCTYTSIPLPVPGFRCADFNTTVLTGATYNTATFKRFTWRAGLEFQATDDSLLYATASSGFRSGGFNSGQTGGAAAPTFKPEKVTAFEIGSKNRFLNDTLQLNLSAYYNRYKDLQEQRQIPFGATTISIIENAARARAYGLEAEAVWKPVPAATITGAFAYLNAKYTRFDQTPAPFGTTILINDPTATTPTVVNGVTIAAAGQRRLFAAGYNCGLIPGTGGAGQPAAAFGCDVSGNRIPHSPEWSGSIAAEYMFDLGNLGTLTPFALVSFSGSFYGQPFNSILEKQKSYAKLDLRLTWDYTEQYSVQLFVTNVTNEKTATRFVWGGGGALQASYGPPRLWGVRASAKF